MPGSGKPSRGCYRCRQRRVKCDLERPQCQRCLRLGQPCPGYRTESDLMFQNESQESYSQSTLRDRRRVIPHHSSGLPNTTLLEIASSVNSEDMAARVTFFDKLICGNIPPPRNLLETWDDHAVPLIISLFSAPTTDGERFYGFMDFFPQMIANAAGTSPLVLCCKAVAFMYFSNRFTTTTEGTKRRVAAYGEALNATKTALDDEVSRSRDETPVSIWLLSIYETLCGAAMSLQCPGSPPTWNMHILGLTSLVRTRPRPELLSGSGRRFFWMSIGVILARSLGTSVECPPEIFSWLEEYIADFVPEDLDMHHTLVHGYRASVWCAKIRGIIDAGNVHESQSISKILEEGIKIGRETEASLSQDPRTRFLHLRQAHIYNFHRAVRVHVQYSILELLQSDIASSDPELGPHFLEKHQSLSISTIQDLTQNIIGTIPLILGSESPISKDFSESVDEPERPRCWMDALRLLWPLRVVGSRKVITNEQRTVVEETLQRLSAEFCMRVAVVPYAIPKQMQLESFKQHQESKRSKGCKTCKRRKVKCDETKPLCRRCSTARLDCEGYENPTVAFDPAQNVTPDHGFIGRLDALTLTKDI